MRFFMKRFICMIVGLFVATLSLMASAETMKSHLSKPIVVKASSPEVVFSLPSNPSTGYSWFLSSFNSNLVMPMKRTFEKSKKNIAGAPGVSTWMFRVHRQAFSVPTITKITMIYARPWDMSHAKTKVITIVTQ